MSVQSYLRAAPGLAELSHTSLDLLAFAFVESAHEPGDDIDPGRGDGTLPRVHVVLDGHVAADGRHLGPGTLFGVVDGTARYRAVSTCRTAQLSPYAYARLSAAPSELARKLRAAMQTALGSTTPPPSATATVTGVPGPSHAAAVGSVLATVVAGLACVGPIVAATLGIGGLGLLAQTAALRIPATIATIALLAFGFARAYAPRRRCAAPSRATRIARGALWGAATFALTMALLQYVTLPHLT